MAKSTSALTNPIQPETVAPRPRGRPSDPDVRVRIMDCAREQFRDRGIEGVSMEKIAEAAGTSKVTVYKYFSSKEKLFNAVLNESRIQAFELRTEEIALGDPVEVLTTVAENYWMVLVECNTMVCMRFFSGNVAANTELLTSFFETGPEKVQRSVARLLQRLDEKGVLAIDDTDVAAEQFLGMLKGMQYIKALFGLPARKNAERKEYVRSCVTMFLRAYAK